MARALRKVQAGSHVVIALLYAVAERGATRLRSLQLLLRVLFVALRGLYLSRRGLEPATPAGLRAARRAAYRTLWALLEAPYWKLRWHNTDSATLRVLLREAGTFFGQHFLCVRRADQTLIDQYLLSLRRLMEVTYPPYADHAGCLWENNAAPPTKRAELAAALEETVELRDRLLRKIRRELHELRRD